MDRSRLVLALALLAACGGRAHSDGEAPGSGQAGNGGSAGTATVAGTAGTTEETAPLSLDDMLPWFDAAGDGDFPDGPMIDKILHIAAGEAPAHATISTHNFYDLTSTESIEFSARATSPTQLLVSFSNGDQDDYDYFASRETGVAWPLAAVQVGLDWQSFSVRIADMRPTEMVDPDGRPSFFCAFIVDHPRPIEVWIDGVSPRPVTASR